MWTFSRAVRPAAPAVRPRPLPAGPRARPGRGRPRRCCHRRCWRTSLPGLHRPLHRTAGACSGPRAGRWRAAAPPAGRAAAGARWRGGLRPRRRSGTGARCA
ncbi:hypothetical protein G6F68_020769 [Rhizopus microsporus]|nr:hypothetical protein G6F68_020769 [Rhizopus microsporus]